MDRSSPLQLDEDEFKELFESNKVLRFGCAQFYKGVCVYPGYLSQDKINDVLSGKYGPLESK